ncbi:MAG: hypothetical protein Q7R88_00205, partial [bacterium]|nr:hypothetical protein [bacterium]
MVAELLFEGNKYITSKAASRLTGYAPDYIGQLCRGGKLQCRMVGRSWYVAEASVLEHKSLNLNADPKKAERLRTSETLAGLQGLTLESGKRSDLSPEVITAAPIQVPAFGFSEKAAESEIPKIQMLPVVERNEILNWIEDGFAKTDWSKIALENPVQVDSPLPLSKGEVPSPRGEGVLGEIAERAELSNLPTTSEPVPLLKVSPLVKGVPESARAGVIPLIKGGGRRPGVVTTLPHKNASAPFIKGDLIKEIEQKSKRIQGQTFFPIQGLTLSPMSPFLLRAGTFVMSLVFVFGGYAFLSAGGIDRMERFARMALPVAVEFARDAADEAVLQFAVWQEDPADAVLATLDGVPRALQAGADAAAAFAARIPEYGASMAEFISDSAMSASLSVRDLLTPMFTVGTPTLAGVGAGESHSVLEEAAITVYETINAGLYSLRGAPTFVYNGVLSIKNIFGKTQVLPESDKGLTLESGKRSDLERVATSTEELRPRVVIREKTTTLESPAPEGALPVIVERTTERIIVGDISRKEVEEKLIVLQNRLAQDIAAAKSDASSAKIATAANTTYINNVYTTVAGTNNLDRVDDLDLFSPTITNGTLIGTTFSGVNGTFNTLTGNAVVLSDTLTVSSFSTSTFAGGVQLATNAGLVSIGPTSTPQASLSIAGRPNQLSPLLLVSTSTASATSTAFVIDSNGKVGVGTAVPTLDFNVLGNSYFSGNVGIGTTSPSATLSVQGNLLVSGSITAITTMVSTSTITGMNFVATDSAATSTFAGGLAVETSGLVYDFSSNKVGIGTAAPNWMLQVSGTRPSFALSDAAAGTDLKHWLFSSMGGNLYIGTSTDAYGTSSPAALTVSNAGRVGIGTTSPGAVFSVQGASLFNGTTTIDGAGSGITFTGSGNHDITAANGTLRIGSNTIIGNIEALDSTVDIGTAATRFDKIYANEVNASTLVGTLTGGNLTAETFSINSDNASADAEDANLAFSRGTLSPNALITWDATGDEFDFNSGFHITNTISATSTGLILDGFTTDITTGTNEHLALMPNGTGNVGVGTTSPEAKLHVLSVGANGQIAVFEDSVADSNPSISIKNDAHDYLLQTVGVRSDNFEIWDETLSATRLAITTAGNVGIGTTSPASLLSVHGNSYVSGTGFFGGAITATSTLAIQSTTATSTFSTGGLTVGTSQFVVQQTSGNVGIGTTSPSRYLSVTDDGTYSAYFSGRVGIGTRSPNRLLELASEGFAGVRYTDTTSGGSSWEAGTREHFAGDFAIRDVTNLATRLLIDSSGNVGLGTTTPYTGLTIYRAAATAAGSPQLTFSASSTVSGHPEAMSNWTIGTDIASGGKFKISSSSVLGTNDRFVIDGAGNVGIGTTSP